MKIAVLGNGVEGKSVAKYFGAKGDEVMIFDEGQDGVSFGNLSFGGFDAVFRSPSVSLGRVKTDKMTSVTRYFFEKCPAKIIGVTATKGKGTICSMIKSILEIRHKVWLVGNIGVAALDVLDEIGENDVVIYEMSSFQLWDLEMSPQTAVVGRIEPDHLNVHESMEDYVGAKNNIVKFQGEGDKTVYFAGNELSREIGERSPAGEKLAYPSVDGAHVADGWFWFGETKLCETQVLKVVGEHNIENALAAIAVCFELADYADVCDGLSSFRGLPHRLELVREVDGVKYYDDNYSSATPATEVAVMAFDEPVILIAGGFDRGLDYADFVKFLNAQKNLKVVLLIGQVAEKMSRGLAQNFKIMKDLEGAVAKARSMAESGDVVVMSPGAASFDNFRNFTHRAEEFQRMVKELQ